MNAEPLSPRCAVIIPAYNEEQTILDVATKALEHTPHVIIVDDASSDQTVKVANQTPATVITHDKNSGKAAALISGFNYVKTLPDIDLIITLDGDGQHNPAHIPELINAFQAYPNRLIIAARLNNRVDAPKARLFANKIADFWIGWAASNRILDTQSGYRVYPLELINHINSHYDKTQGFVFESEALIKASKLGISFAFVPIDSVYPEQRRASHFRPFFDIMQITRMVGTNLLRSAFNIPGLIRYFSISPSIYNPVSDK